MKGHIPLEVWITWCLTPRIARTIPKQYEGDTPPVYQCPPDHDCILCRP